MTNKPPSTYQVQEDQPADWFEPLYANANLQGEGVPWANMDTHPFFKEWLNQHSLAGKQKRALVIGCGLGDDAIELEKLGFTVTAFDVSESAIKLCKTRFPDSSVHFIQADLFNPPQAWFQYFDFVLEIYTVQALPPKYEAALISTISNFVAPQGQLLVIAEVGQDKRDFKKGPPWLLTPAHIDAFTDSNLTVKYQQIQQGALDSQSKTYVTTFQSTMASI